MPDGWNLRRRVRLPAGEIAYDVLGYGPPVILVHGTPSRSYVWRKVVSKLADHCTGYAGDLLGFGEAERREGLDVSIAAQARLLAELVETWGLEEPAIAGHDIGGGVALRAHLIEEVPFRRIALIDAVVLAPWITPTTRHVKTHLDVYATMPAAVVNAPLGSANTETSNGGTMAFLAVSSISIAACRSRPPRKMPVRLTPLGPREKIASCTRSPTSPSSTPVYGMATCHPASMPMLTSNGLRFFAGVIMWRM